MADNTETAGADEQERPKRKGRRDNLEGVRAAFAAATAMGLTAEDSLLSLVKACHEALDAWMAITPKDDVNEDLQWQVISLSQVLANAKHSLSHMRSRMIALTPENIEGLRGELPAPLLDLLGDIMGVVAEQENSAGREEGADESVG